MLYAQVSFDFSKAAKCSAIPAGVPRPGRLPRWLVQARTVRRGDRVGRAGMAAEVVIEIGHVEVVIGADVAGQLGAFFLLVVSLDDSRLDKLTGPRINRMGDVRMELGTPLGVARCPFLIQMVTAAVAEPRAQMILGPARGAAIC